jgi:nucleoside-diphosphate-sugar epimerase
MLWMGHLQRQFISNMKSKIVITGGAGFIGTHIAEYFSNRFSIVLFDNLLRNSINYAPALTQSAKVKFVKGDIRDKSAVKAVLSGADAVLHLAGIAGVSSYYKQPVETLRVNILGTFNLLDAMLETGVRRMLYLSTSEMYGPQAENANETSSPMVSGPVSERRWVYAVSKLAGEHAVLRYGDEFDLQCTCVRPFNIYGPRQTGEGAISNFARHLVEGKPLQIYGDGNDIRAWCYISDLVYAIDQMLDNDAAYGQSFNIGNPDARCTTTELARKMIEVYEMGEIEYITTSHSPIRIRFPNIDFAQEKLNYHPRIGLAEGLKKTLNWFKEESQI